MPKVNPKESQDKYLSRCIPIVMKENGGDQKAAAGKCYGMYRQSKKKKQSKGDLSEPDFDKENNFEDFIFIPN